MEGYPGRVRLGRMEVGKCNTVQRFLKKLRHQLVTKLLKKNPFDFHELQSTDIKYFTDQDIRML